MHEIPTREAARARLDEADQAVLHALKARREAAWALARVEGTAVRTDREAETLKHLLAQRLLPPRTAVRLWRELIGETSGVERVSVWGGREPGLTVDMARRRFGAAPQITPASRPEEALSAAKRPGAVAVLALDLQVAWWARLLVEPALRIFATLPDLAAEGPLSAVAVGDVAVEPTGSDETFWVTDAPEPAARIEEALGLIGFASRPLLSTGGLKLFALTGYVQRDDARLARAPGRLTGVVGAAPTPFDL